MKNQPNFFFLLISPPPEVVEYVAYLKQLVHDRIGHGYRSHRSIAHLTLFQYYDYHNESNLYKYGEVVFQFRPFTIYLRDFSAFAKNRTIFLNIEYTHDVCALAEQLGYHIKPHITIARSLPTVDFDRAWEVLQNCTYTYSFTCDHVTVLKWSNEHWNNHLYLPLKK